VIAALSCSTRTDDKASTTPISVFLMLGGLVIA